MPVRGRRPRGAVTKPRRKADVPDWLTTNYEVVFRDGEPELEGWSTALSEARRTSESTVLWRERATEARDEALRWSRKPEDPQAERRAREYRIRYLKCALAVEEGRRFPHAETIACAEFINILLVLSGLPLAAIAYLAWWKGYQRAEPKDKKRLRDIERLARRRWLSRPSR